MRMYHIRKRIDWLMLQSVKYNYKKKDSTLRRADYERNVEARFKAFLKENRISKEKALNLVTGDAEGGCGKYPLVASFIRLQTQREIEKSHNSAQKC